MKTKDANWLEDKIQNIKKKKRKLSMLQDPELIKKIKKDLKVERRSVKRANKQYMNRHIQEEIEKYGQD